METKDIVFLSINGIAIIVNVIVTIILSTQIKKQKDIINSMEKFMNIFDIKKIEDYVALNEKKNKMENEQYILDTILPIVMKSAADKVNSILSEKGQNL